MNKDYVIKILIANYSLVFTRRKHKHKDRDKRFKTNRFSEVCNVSIDTSISVRLSQKQKIFQKKTISLYL